MGDTPNYKQTQEALKLLESGRPVGPRTYEVDIHARPEQFLDWDRPIAPKTPVREMIADLGMKGTGSAYPDVRNAAKDAFLAAQSPNLTGEGAYRSLIRANLDAPVGKSAVRASDQLREAGIPGIRYLDQGSRLNTNQYMMRELERNLDMAQQQHAMAKKSGDAAYIAREQENLAKAEAAMKLPPPTSNYVVFDPNILSIAKKYGLAGAVPTMGALAAMDKYGGESRP